MYEKIYANSSDSGDIKITECIPSDNVRYTAVFVVDNRQHIDLFLPLQRYMRDFKIFYINLTCWGTKRFEIEDYLVSLNAPYVTIYSLFTKKSIVSFLQRVNPNIVILGHDTNPQNREIIRVATDLNIPTLLVQDGIYADNETLCRANKKTLMDRLRIFPSLLLDTHYSSLDIIDIVACSIKSMILPRSFVGRGEYSSIAVFGYATKDLLEREGVDSGKIIVTGSPKFDYLCSWNRSEGCLTRQQLGIHPDKKIILVITQPFVESGMWTQCQRGEYVSQVGMTVEKIDDCQLIIKFRQNRENSRDYNDISKFYGINPVICGDINLYDLIEISEAVITVSSTGGLETIAADKPLIIFDPFDTPGSSFYNSGDVLFIRNVDDLSSAINKIISDRLFRENLIYKQHLFLEENIFKNDGNATERIYNHIINMIKN